MEVNGSTVLLTGATGGLGRAIATRLANDGASLILSARSAEALAELAAGLPGEHALAPCDLAEAGAAGRLAAEAGEADVVVANAGLPGTGRLQTYDADGAVRVQRVNLEAPIELTRALIPRMLERGRGHFVYMGSLSGKVASPRSSLYSATKAGLRGFCLGIRQDLQGTGIGATVISAGFIREAGMFHDAGSKAPPGLGTRRPEQVAAAVVKAVERGPAEIAVASPVLRAVSHFGLVAPGVAEWVQRKGGADRRADELAAGQNDKR